MSSISDRVGKAFDDMTAASDAPPVETLNAAPTPEQPDTAKTADTTEATPDSAETTAETPAATPVTTATPQPRVTETAPAVDTSDLKAVKDRFLAEHPELTPVMDAFLKEAERGLNRKFERLAEDRKALAEQTLYAEVAQEIPKDEFLGLTNLYRTVKRGTPQQKLEAADHLFRLQESLRGEVNGAGQAPQNYSNTNNNTYLQQQVAELRIDQETQRIQAQIDSAFTALKSEFGGSDIPASQREHVGEELQKLGINDVNAALNAIPLVWRGLYGADYKTVAALKKGQSQRAEKEGLGVGQGVAPGTRAAAATGKPKGVKARMEAFLAENDVR